MSNFSCKTETKMLKSSVIERKKKKKHKYAIWARQSNAYSRKGILPKEEM